eukprot:31023-Pelagococcus_subviridis.AAC.2
MFTRLRVERDDFADAPRRRALRGELRGGLLRPRRRAPDRGLAPRRALPQEPSADGLRRAAAAAVVDDAQVPAPVRAGERRDVDVLDRGTGRRRGRGGRGGCRRRGVGTLGTLGTPLGERRFRFRRRRRRVRLDRDVLRTRLKRARELRRFPVAGPRDDHLGRPHDLYRLELALDVLLRVPGLRFVASLRAGFALLLGLGFRRVVVARLAVRLALLPGRRVDRRFHFAAGGGVRVQGLRRRRRDRHRRVHQPAAVPARRRRDLRGIRPRVLKE